LFEPPYSAAAIYTIKKPAVQETPGEDPHTNGAYATALAHGMQGTDPNWLQISGCAKHFAVHSWNTPSTYMAYPTKQDLADTYLPAFEAAVKAGISGFMCRSCRQPHYR
jgi:beta-glucosidase